jgi:hypothetical protein
MIDEISANSAPFFTPFKWAKPRTCKLSDVTDKPSKNRFLTFLANFFSSVVEKKIGQLVGHSRAKSCNFAFFSMGPPEITI